jgi:hypothetical protein
VLFTIRAHSRDIYITVRKKPNLLVLPSQKICFARAKCPCLVQIAVVRGAVTTALCIGHHAAVSPGPRYRVQNGEVFRIDGCRLYYTKRAYD